MEKFVEFVKVSKHYKMGEAVIKASDEVSFSIDKGEFVIILGHSGAGKTTILNILGGMDTCDAGEVIVDGAHIEKYKNKDLTKYRRNDVGFIFQFYNLMPNLTALENVEISSEICKNTLPSLESLKLVGLEERKNNFPSQLSGGEQQRVAIARAVAKNPKILLADEPTGALDYQTGKKILQILQDCARLNKQTVIVITHNMAMTPMADKVIYLKNGSVEKIVINSSPTPIDEIEW